MLHLCHRGKFPTHIQAILSVDKHRECTFKCVLTFDPRPGDCIFLPGDIALRRLLNNSAFYAHLCPIKVPAGERWRIEGETEGRREEAEEEEDTIHNTCSDSRAAPLVRDTEQTQAGEFPDFKRLC